ncbi:MAG: hypothetical protein ACXVCI_22295, partial [Bdellovibrionota bacterium]
MRFLLFFFGLFLLSPNEAGAAPSRKAASLSNGPARVITFSCRENADEPVLALGIAHLRVDPKDSNAAEVAVNLHVQVKKNKFSSKSYRGSAVSVPGGYSLALRGPEAFTLNLHPNERTKLPGLSFFLECESTAM